MDRVLSLLRSLGVLESTETLSRMIGFRNLVVDLVDLVVLNHASPILAFEAISGVNLLCRAQTFQAEFFSLTSRFYEDDMAMLARGLRYRRAAS